MPQGSLCSKVGVSPLTKLTYRINQKSNKSIFNTWEINVGIF